MIAAPIHNALRPRVLAITICIYPFWRSGRSLARRPSLPGARRNELAHIGVRYAETFFEGLGEVGSIVVRVIELVLVFDVESAAVSGIGQRGEKAFPIDHARARQPEAPPPGIVDWLNAAAAHQ